MTSKELKRHLKIIKQLAKIWGIKALRVKYDYELAHLGWVVRLDWSEDKWKTYKRCFYRISDTNGFDKKGLFDFDFDD